MSFPQMPASRLWRSIIGALLACALALGLGACSAVKIGYERADELIYWWLDSYLDWDDTQSVGLRRGLSALQRWHRQQELPRYAATLQDWATQAQGDLSAPQLCRAVDEVRARLTSLLDQAEPVVVALAPTITQAQRDHLARQFERHNRTWREDWLESGAQEYQGRRLGSWRDRLEHFYGSLNSAQLQVLQQRMASSIFDPALQAQEMQRRQQDQLRTLGRLSAAGQSASAAPPDARWVASEMRALLERSLSSSQAQYRTYQDQLTREACATVAAVHQQASPAQKQHLVQVLLRYSRQARELADNP